MHNDYTFVVVTPVCKTDLDRQMYVYDKVSLFQITYICQPVFISLWFGSLLVYSANFQSMLGNVISTAAFPHMELGAHI